MFLLRQPQVPGHGTTQLPPGAVDGPSGIDNMAVLDRSAGVWLSASTFDCNLAVNAS